MGKYQERHEKKKLYRTVNTATHDVNHFYGGEYRWGRKKQKIIEEESPFFQSMRGRKRRGIDYTPLFMFLLNKVGEEWDLVYSEAIKRLDKSDPIFWLVALHPEDKRDFVRCGESSSQEKLTAKQSP